MTWGGHRRGHALWSPASLSVASSHGGDEFPLCTVRLDSGDSSAAAAVGVVEGPQLVCLLCQLLRVLVVHSRQQDPDLPGKALQKNSPLGQVSNMAAIISEGFLLPSGGMRKSLSAF